MMTTGNNPATTLIFVYNAGSGFMNSLLDSAHKLFSPKTYQCNLCAITHHSSGMRNEWKEFLDGLNINMEFLHRDELEKKGIEGNFDLPAVLVRKKGSEAKVAVSAKEINACKSSEELQKLVAGIARV